MSSSCFFMYLLTGFIVGKTMIIPGLEHYCKAINNRNRIIVVGVNVILWCVIWVEEYGLVHTIILAFFASILLVLAVIDKKKMIIPNFLIILIIILGIVATFVPEMGNIYVKIIGLVIISVPLQIISCIIPRAFGGGDIKLMAAAGFLLGFKIVCVAMYIGLVIGGVQGLYLIKNGKGRKTKFPFGPSLAIGLYIACLWGEALWKWIV